MLRTIGAIVLLCTLTACSSIPLVTVGMAGYPHPTYEERKGIKQMLTDVDMPAADYRAAYDLAKRVDSGEVLSSEQVAKYERLIILERRWKREKDAAWIANLDKVRRDREEKSADERKLAQERSDAREAEEKKAHYFREFNAINSPESAKEFKAKYGGWNEPGVLTSSAMKKGLAEGIASAQQCIDYSNRVIQRQKEIGNEVGYVDKSAIYQAGASLVACRKQLARYKAETLK
jgi:hypothetical protein